VHLQVLFLQDLGVYQGKDIGFVAEVCTNAAEEELVLFKESREAFSHFNKLTSLAGHKTGSCF
jgi:hypothetical protein